jgi:hypothetical protein
MAKDGPIGIATVARRWGFPDATHFGRRFRAAYGISPREWRQVQEQQRAPARASDLGEIMLLLDTSAYPVEDRAEILRGGLAELAGVDLAPVDGDALMKLRFRAWDVGDGCSLLNAQSSGFRPSRRPSDESPVIGFGMMPSGSARFSQNDRQEIVPGGGMFITEMSEKFTCKFAESSEGINLMVPLEVLDIPLRAPARSRQPGRGPLLLVAGGKDELIREMSTALLHRDYRRRQRDAVTDYKVFPDMNHTLGLGTSGVDVLFYCLDWLTAQNM